MGATQPGLTATMPEMMQLFERGKVKRGELHRLLRRANIDVRFRPAVEREWRGSKRMA